MKQFYALCFTLYALCFMLKAQNFVLNPGFENKSSCPNSISQLSLATPWYNPTTGTPDYFHICSNPSSVGVPNNGFGYQYAKSGVAYAGFYTFNKGYPNSREYIQDTLSDTLKMGQLYCVSFYVSLANEMKYATNTIGAYFSQTAISGGNNLLPYTPQVVNSSINPLMDTLGWTLISGNFIAGGGEQYLTIGNFNTDATSDTIFLGPRPQNYIAAYYYIDDISVIACDTTDTVPVKIDTLCGEVFIPNAFSPDGNGENDLECVYGKCIATMEFSIYNRWGEKVFETTDPKLCWDGTYNGTLMNTAVFAYYFKATLTTGETISKKGNISLIR